MPRSRKVGVVGAGTMGSGVAQAAAIAGYEVILYDIDEDYLERALRTITSQIDKGVERGKVDRIAAAKAKAHLELTDDLEDVAETDLIVEAAPEKIDLKRSIFAQLENMAPDHTIFATNTSSLSVNVLSGTTRRPDRFVGLHFFNPAHIMKLVEVIPTDYTSENVLKKAFSFVQKMGKEPVLCQDTPAFIVNRVARPFYGEALRILGENQANVAEIDQLMESIGFRMGPFKLIDLIGADVNFAVTQSVYQAYFHDSKYRPHPIQQKMVESGRLGRKTERGFYSYDS